MTPCLYCQSQRFLFIEGMKKKGVDVNKKFVQDLAAKVRCGKHTTGTND